MLTTKEQKELFNKIMRQIEKNTKKSLQNNNETRDTNSNKTSNQSES
jgi:GTPase SAR1 family protein